MRLRELFGLASFQFLINFRRAIFFTFLSIYMYFELGVSATLTNSLFFMSMTASSLGQSFIWGKVSDRFQIRRKLIVLGEGVAALVHILMFYVHIWTFNVIGGVASGLVLILMMAVLEAFWSASNVGWSALLSDMTDETTRRRIIGPISAFGGVGTIIGAFLAAFLYDFPRAGEGFRQGTIFYVTAFVIMFSAVLVLKTLPEGGTALASDKLNEPLISSESIKTPRAYWFLLIATLVYFMGSWATYTTLPLYASLKSTFNATSIQIALIRTAWASSLILIAPLVTIMTNRLGLRWSFLLSAGITVLTIPALALAPTFELYLLVILAQGGFQNASTQISYLLASEIIPLEARGRLFGYYNGLSFLTFGLGGVIVTGPVIDLAVGWGSPQALAFQLAFLSAFGWVLLGIICHLPVLKFVTRKEKSHSGNELASRGRLS
ncbi:MAG: MFS transporter [Promethearchaeota archaeon]